MVRKVRVAKGRRHGNVYDKGVRANKGYLYFRLMTSVLGEDNTSKVLGEGGVRFLLKRVEFRGSRSRYGGGRLLMRGRTIGQ